MARLKLGGRGVARLKQLDEYQDGRGEQTAEAEHRQGEGTGPGEAGRGSLAAVDAIGWSEVSGHLS